MKDYGDTTASADKPYFFHSMHGDTLFFAKEEDRDAAVREEIQYHIDEGICDEEVEQIFAGRATHTVKQTNVRYRPTDVYIDEDGIDPYGDDWSHGDDAICNYELIPLEPVTQTGSTDER